MTSSNIDDRGRPEPPVASDEVSTLLGFLEFQRATLEWKCRDLDSTDLQKKTSASSMTLGGVLKHMAYVENHWFSDWLMGRDKLSPWREVDWSHDRDWDWYATGKFIQPDVAHGQIADRDRTSFGIETGEAPE